MKLAKRASNSRITRVLRFSLTTGVDEGDGDERVRLWVADLGLLLNPGTGFSAVTVSGDCCLGSASS